MTPAPTKSEYIRDYGFEPKDEACTQCPRSWGQHSNAGHLFIPAGKPVAKS